MVRIVKKAKDRKKEILETAQEFFYSKGYDATTIEDIINRVGIAKGTFYYYFKSKEDLLSQLANYQIDTVIAMLEDKLEEFDGNALEKFRFVVSNISQWKLERKDLMIAYIEFLYRDENIPLRFKMYEGYEKIAPLFSEIIAEGQRQGLFNVDDADETSEIFISMLQGFGERIASQVLLLGEKPETVEAVLGKCLAFEKALERVLGLKSDTLKIYDPETLKRFFDYFIEKSNEENGGTGMSSEKSALSTRQSFGGGVK